MAAAADKAAGAALVSNSIPPSNRPFDPALAAAVGQGAAAPSPGSPLRLRDLLRVMVKEGASDMLLKAGGCPAIRVAGTIRFLGDHALTSEAVRGYVSEVLNDRLRAEFERSGASDSAVALPGVGRFRCNAFHQCGDLGLVFRAIKNDVPSFKDLNLPAEQLKRLASLKRGLVLATGVAGSGKSTTLAAMIEYINRTMNKHIVTVEDPIEFRFEEKRSIVNQREIGVDVTNFAAALRQAMRQSPDIIFIGEMRDAETVSAALSAAETGHLVFSTRHTVNAVQTVERIISFFPPHQHEMLRLQLALNLAGVCSLRLIKNKDATGMVPAIELLVNNPTVRDLLEQGQTRQLPKALAEGSYYGTVTFNQSLIRLYQAGNITLEDALASSDNPDDLKMQMRGITLGGGVRPGLG
ncbi:MAG: type IV pilus twitching motility protein PilT [Planctomycetota bacterium]